MKTYLASSIAESLKDGKRNLSVVRITAKNEKSAEKKFWLGDYATVIDGGGKIVEGTLFFTEEGK